MISWLITTFNRKAQLKNTLKRMKFLTLPDELVIVDDGNDETGLMVAKTVRDLGLGIPVNYIHRPKDYYDICGISRNVGIKACNGDTIIISDPECMFLSDIIPQMQKRAVELPRNVISAGVVYRTKETTVYPSYFAENPYKFLSETKVDLYPHETNDANSITKTSGWVASFVVWYKKQWLMDIGGYDEAMSINNGGGGYAYDDVDLLTRLRIMGHNQTVDTDIETFHQWHKPHDGNTDSGDINLRIMKAKDLDRFGYGNPELVANKGKDWGK